jgi:hypothetical protein
LRHREGSAGSFEIALTESLAGGGSGGNLFEFGKGQSKSRRL